MNVCCVFYIDECSDEWKSGEKLNHFHVLLLWLQFRFIIEFGNDINIVVLLERTLQILLNE